MSDDSRAELVAGTVVLAVAAGFLAFAAGPRLMPGGGYDLIAAFPNVEGIEKGSEIRMAGVPVGRVTEISLNPATYLAEARLRLQDGVLLPADSAAIIQSDGLLGGAYLELQPGGSPENLAPGDEIEDVQGAVSLLSLMMKFVDSQAAETPGADPAPEDAQ
ncbi:outer membrane lipid asymmetry maintenance protein MlaD [Paracoccus sp. S1E-3]|uniref:outer membrane lipid asymmetry maintenance protein MlaD n=1 Tax=Paracoccus sp. S1E-3 TaxID=2756130 RepID=UPI0015EF877E|nr:outer membrane lipid asymmetry maintenance protein MlaD [Paracoccus sp. S1E-3]MBA4490379.1 outer membrane lipid asymmetry maintenance protein MlaD [Paracoccus sp. S1E-3]